MIIDSVFPVNVEYIAWERDSKEKFWLYIYKGLRKAHTQIHEHITLRARLAVSFIVVRVTLHLSLIIA